MLDKKTGISVRTCGSDSKRLHGAAPLLLIYDEMAQWPPNSVKPMLAALGNVARQDPERPVSLDRDATGETTNIHFRRHWTAGTRK